MAKCEALAKDCGRVVRFLLQFSHIHGIDDPVKRNATISIINNFGQTPKQVRIICISVIYFVVFKLFTGILCLKTTFLL